MSAMMIQPPPLMKLLTAGPEPCIVCGTPTSYSKGLPTKGRAGYVPNRGPLCSKCCTTNFGDERYTFT